MEDKLGGLNLIIAFVNVLNFPLGNFAKLKFLAALVILTTVKIKSVLIKRISIVQMKELFKNKKIFVLVRVGATGGI